MTAGEDRKLTLPAGAIEVLDIPGDTVRPPLLLLHEGLGSVGLWRSFPHDLAAATGCRTVAFSRYGHGQSDLPPKPRTPAFMHEEAVEVLPQLIERLGLQRPMLIGHSDGASIALIYAAHHPLAGLVAMAPHVFVEDITLQAIRQARDDYRETNLRERLARHHQDPDAAFHGWCDVWLAPDFPNWDIRPLLPRINAPILLIQGLRDKYGTMAQLDAIEQAAAGPVERLELDSDHGPHFERTRETLEAIAGFIARRATAPSSAGTAPPPAARTPP